VEKSTFGELSVHSLRKSGLSVEEISKVFVKSMNRVRLFDNHIAGSEIGIEQTLADLRAIDQGGSVYSRGFERQLVEYFRELDDFLKAHDWFRR